MKRGFTLVEIVVVVAVFLIITTAVSGTYVKIYQLIQLNKTKVVALDLANEQIEIIRNLPYEDVGEISGIPSGKLHHTSTTTRSGIDFTITDTIRNIDDPFDGQIGSSTNNDLSPADYKLVEVDVQADSAAMQPVSLVTYVAPKNLEGASTNGALFVKVFDADGIPIQGANVHIENNTGTSSIVIDDITNSQGLLTIVDVPPSTGYNITVSKDGYSTDKTYPSGAPGNPNPSKPDATVIVQQVTQVSFAIDKLSSIDFQTVNLSCQPIPNVDFNLTGSKLIGTPDVYKYSEPLSTGSDGTLHLGSLEWDSYTPNLTDGTYELIGSNPLIPINLIPDSTQAVEFVVAPKDPDTLVVGVSDGATGLPLSDAEVTLSSGSFNKTLSTGRGFTGQTDWSGGSGQSDFSADNRYLSDDGNIDTTSNPGELTLDSVFGQYRTSGWLESSTFDLGTTTNFKKIVWDPLDQPVGSGPDSVKLQIATSQENTSTTTWNFIGPDDTSNTYFTTSNQNIDQRSAARYLRYKVYLSTESPTSTPNVSDILVTYTSECLPPGQAAFTHLSPGTYRIDITEDGYQDYSDTVDIDSSHQSKNIILST